MERTGTAHQERRPGPRTMRLAKREVTDPEQLRAIVDACPAVRIGAVDGEGVFVVPMSFGYDWEAGSEANADGDEDADASERPGDGANTAASNRPAPPRLTLWLHSAREGRKAAAFDQEPQVAVEMDVQEGVLGGSAACAYSYAYRSIMGTGRIRRVTRPEEKRHGLARIMVHLDPAAPTDFADAAVERTNVYRIDLDRFTGKENRR